MKKLLTVSIFCSFLFVELNAQNAPDERSSWVTVASTDELTMSPTKQTVFNKIKVMKGYENPVAIHVKRIARSIAGDGSLSFNLPGVTQSLKARSIYIDAESEETYEWMGEFEDEMGSMTVVSDKGKIRAHIFYGDEAYEIFPVDKDTHVLMKVKKQSYTGNECATPHTNGNIENIKNDRLSSNARIIACPETIRVLALTTPAARTEDPNLNQTIQLAISQFNQARSNSLITSQANIILAEIRDTNFVENAGNILADRNAIIANEDFQDWRDEENADIVLMFTNGDYNGGVVGIAGSLLLNADSAYAIAEIPFATTTYTATHEIGHLFGSRHQFAVDDTPGFHHGFRWSYGFWIWTTKRHTIMHTQQLDHTRQLYFSNPNISDHGKAMGTTDLEYNARWIGEHANQVSLFRTGGGVMTAYIEGPYELYPEYPYGIWEAVVGCGDAPFTYAWQVSLDGFNYGNVLGTGETFGNFAFENFYLRLTVTSNDGQQRISTHYVWFNSSAYRLSEELTEDINSVSELSDLDMSLGNAYPNPSSNEAYIPFSVQQKQEIKIELLDFNGKQLRTLAEGEYEKDNHYISFNTSKLKTGLYLYKLTGRDFKNVKKIMIDK